MPETRGRPRTSPPLVFPHLTPRSSCRIGNTALQQLETMGKRTGFLTRDKCDDPAHHEHYAGAIGSGKSIDIYSKDRKVLGHDTPFPQLDKLHIPMAQQKLQAPEAKLKIGVIGDSNASMQNAINWTQLRSESELQDALDNNGYYGGIVIPANFTSQQVSSTVGLGNAPEIGVSEQRQEPPDGKHHANHAASRHAEGENCLQHQGGE